MDLQVPEGDTLGGSQKTKIIPTQSPGIPDSVPLPRYINHSCAPNCVAEVVTFDKEDKIIIISSRRIPKGEEVRGNILSDKAALSSLPFPRATFCPQIGHLCPLHFLLGGWY